MYLVKETKNLTYEIWDKTKEGFSLMILKAELINGELFFTWNFLGNERNHPQAKKALEVHLAQKLAKILY